jgi:hypothetical protein
MYSLGRYNCFIVRAYLRLSITKERKIIKSNLKRLSEIWNTQIVASKVDTCKAKGNDEGRMKRNSPTNQNRHEQGLDKGCRESGLCKCGSAKADKG